MENKVILFLLFINLFSCNDKTKEPNCGDNGLFILKGFENIKINQIHFKNSLNTIDYQYDIKEMDSVAYDETRIIVNDSIYSNFADNDFKIIINDNLEFLVSDVNMKPIERFGNFGSVGYECVLIDYNVNGSLMKESEKIIKYSLHNKIMVKK